MENMDWVSLLSFQQADFIQKFKSGYLLNGSFQNQYSEIIAISGDKLCEMIECCWEATEKNKQSSYIRESFSNNLKLKLIEESVKSKFDDFILDLSNNESIQANDFIFKLDSNPLIKILIKSCQYKPDHIEWSIQKKEIEKISAILYVLILEDLTIPQNVYNIVIAGFTTNNIVINNTILCIKLEDLLYFSGLKYYLSTLEKSQINNLIQVGNIHFKEQDYTNAITYYSQALQINNKSADIHFMRGKSRYLLGDISGAINDFSQTLEINPNFIDAYILRGSCNYNLGCDYEVLEDYTQAIKIDPNNFNAYVLRGDIHFYLGDEIDSIQDYNKAIEINANCDYIYFMRGSVYHEIGQYNEALTDYNAALKINSINPECYFKKGCIYYEFGDKEVAISYFNQAANLWKEINKIEDSNKDTINFRKDSGNRVLTKGTVEVEYQKYEPKLASRFRQRKFEPVI
ncbi:TPR repeat protein (plasmid) [Trichormus variabilis ATCC 29413]|uniref:TPR repeat protein n=2 Tax=Anabaena variabilis TaxID=264691 RepID=Q3M1X6_TRIV2|nr:tetratricopeptide repeat protein [Trichormus variabilis]ABA25010.1 TPR repeat protein [Trichormus variabilis ATCC 29413]QHD83645.1 tetratricopeptide repeat protein [Trichormus variabilis 0441]